MDALAVGALDAAAAVRQHALEAATELVRTVGAVGGAVAHAVATVPAVDARAVGAPEAGDAARGEHALEVAAGRARGERGVRRSEQLGLNAGLKGGRSPELVGMVWALELLVADLWFGVTGVLAGDAGRPVEAQEARRACVLGVHLAGGKEVPVV